jgi:16S rRNA (adenine1518-N6/adenine1519-N6)-dimethyltransferase
MTAYRKRLGQHFLQNIGAARRIVDLLSIDRGDSVLEIGPGAGALTGFLAELPIELVAVEIDKGLASQLAKRFRGRANVRIEGQDILEFDFDPMGCSRRWKVVGNLPYNTASLILARVFRHSRCFSRGVFTLQREVADRLTADTGSSEYSSLTVFGQVYCDAGRAFLLKPGSFFPPPKVSSAVVTLTFRDPQFVDQDTCEDFHRFVQGVFSHRRKMILNGLTYVTSLGKDILQSLLGDIGIDYSIRPQNLSLQQFVSLFEALTEVHDA